MLILCDFDGTLITEDLTHHILDFFTGTTWRTELLPPFLAGIMSPLEIMSRAYRPLAAPPEEILRFIQPLIAFRPGVERFVAACREREWPFVVVSGGIELYVRHALPPGIPYHCYAADFDGKGWDVRLPADVTLDGEEDFKVHLLKRHRTAHPGRPVIYIGDGRNDFAAARHADRVFAITGSRLSKLLAADGIPCTEFSHFDAVLDALIVQSRIR